MEDGYDIALVKLHKEANLTLPSIDKQGGKFHPGRSFTALGWGLNETGKYPTSLQMTDGLTYAKHHICKEELQLDFVEGLSICAGFSEKNENTCKGVMLAVSVTICQASLSKVILEVRC